jgi:hypothetical protein
MSKLWRAAVIAASLSLMVGTAHARGAHVARGLGSHVVSGPVQQVSPQFNNPGPQARIAGTGNPVSQLAPIHGLSAAPSSLGIR